MATSLSFDLKPDQLRVFLNNLNDYEKWYQSLMAFLPAYNITTREQVCAFLAQTHHESAGYRHLDENLNYRWESLRRVWPRHFPTDEIAKQYAHSPERIANRAYADRMGNGNEASGDGWRYRGQGLIQLTGRDNQSRFANDVKKPLADMMDYLGTFNGAVESACWFWKTNNLNRWVNSADFDGLSDSINLGRKTSAVGDAHGYQDRINQYNRAMEITGGVVSEQVSQVVLKNGSRGPAVVKLQTTLGVTADGVFGNGTETALRKWQSDRGLVVDGIAGPSTLVAMGIN